MDYSIKIENLNKNYPSFSLKDVSFSLPKGYIMGFIGKNGSGKSTTIGIALGLKKADSGVCQILGENSYKLSSETKEKIGVVLDECCLPGTLNYVQINKVLSDIYKNWDSEKFLGGCENYNFDKKTIINKYSKGMKMKISILSAICHRPELLILDEPTSGLDPEARSEIMDMLLDFVQDENKSVLISSHITSDLEKVCDYITMINNGKIIFSEEKDKLLEEYGILHCANSDFDKIDKSAVISSKQTQYSTNALVKRSNLKGDYIIDKPSLEDIMLYCSKEA